MNLHDAGIGIAIDDFGTGYSSLSHLSSLPVDELKIDRSFVKDMISNKDNAFIVRSTIELGHSLGLKGTSRGRRRPAHLGSAHGARLRSGARLLYQPTGSQLLV